MYQSTHTGAQVDEAVDKVLASPISMMSNRNLLDNWYFVGGGSQQGGGQFPINQRGNTSYSGAVYGIDRWKGANAYGNIAVQSDGLQINSIANAFFAIDQIIENGATNLNGKTVTLSVLLPSGDIVQGSATLNLTGTSQAFIQFNFSGSDGIAQVNASTSGVSVRLRVQNNKTVKVAAVKLELGSVSTLANDAPPCFAEELAKCQRYAFVPKIPSGSQYLALGFNLGASASPTLNTMITTPVIMRSTPTASGSLHSIRGNGVQIASSISIGTALAPVGNTVIVPINTSSSFPALTMGYGVLFSSLVLSADL